MISKNFLSPFFLNNFAKTFFVRNICKFYIFVGNNYPQRNYLSIKTLRKKITKKIFLQNFVTNLHEKFYEENPISYIPLVYH